MFTLAPVSTGNLVSMLFMGGRRYRAFVVGTGVSRTEKTDSSLEEKDTPTSQRNV